MVEVAGRPIIVHQFDWLKRYGVEKFIVTIGHLKERFLEALGSGRKYGVHVSYVVEEEPLGTAGGLKNARALVDREDAFYVLNGDVLTDIDPRKTLEALDGGALGVIALVSLQSPYGVVSSDEKGYVTLFREKPTLGEYWINAGLYAFKPKVFEYLPDRGDLEAGVFQKLAEMKLLKSVKYSDYGFWKSVETWKDLEEAERLLARGGGRLGQC
jgi:glucose-1-phosphate thymidylyltransferase